MLYTIKEEHPEAVKEYLTPIIGSWNEAFIAILNKRTLDNPEIEVGEWGLKTEILKVESTSLMQRKLEYHVNDLVTYTTHVFLFLNTVH